MTQLTLSQWHKPCFGGFWKRYGAFLIDSLLIGAASKILLNLTVHRLVSPDLAADSWWYELIKLALFLGYFVGTSLLLEGQTVGKLLLGLKVVNITTGQADQKTLLLRELAGRTILYFAPFLALILMFTPQRQHLIDIACDTAVLDLRQMAYFEKAKETELVLPGHH